MKGSAVLVILSILASAAGTGAADGGEPQPVVHISEVHPSPAGEAVHEFLELHVPPTSGCHVDLEGWTLSDGDGGPDLTFGRVTMAPGSYLVVWTSRPRDGPQGISIGRRSPIWNDEGDDVALLDPRGTLVACLAYGTGEAVDPGPQGEDRPSVPVPTRGMSIALDPMNGTYIEARPSPGGPSVPVAPGPGPPEPVGDAEEEPPAETHHGVPPPVLIEAVHPGGALDCEHLILSNPQSRTVDVSGWWVEDGEGSLRVPEGATMGPGASCSLAVNASAFRALWGGPPTWTGDVQGGFGLADRGDGIVLRDSEGAAVDQVCYGDLTGPCPTGWSGGPVATPSTLPWGRLLKRTSRVDTDSALDWLGWTEPRCGWLAAGGALHGSRVEATCFVTPHEGWDRLAWVIASAREALTVSLYDVTSLDLCGLLARRAEGGVGVRLLVEGTPVGLTGGEADHREMLLASLAAAGVEVHTATPRVEGSVHRPYRYHHEKWCVADGETVLVTTENWVPSSFPASGNGGAHGSRGWGVVIVDEALSAALLDVFEHDILWASGPPEAAPDDLVDLPASEGPMGAAPRLESAEARLLVGPEAWGPDLGAITSVLDGATESILLELSVLEVRWGDGTSPLVEALLGAAARGVDVRLVLDAGFDGDGEACLDELHLLAGQRGLWNVRGVLASGLPGASRVHAKGAVVDGRTAVLGSMNWALSSVARNREVVAVVDSADAVRGLVEAFERDWEASCCAVGTRVPAAMMEAMLARWEAPEDATSLGRPLDRPREDREARGPGREPGWVAWARGALVVAFVMSLWSLDRRHALRARFWAWYVRRVHNAARRTRDLIHRRSGEGTGTQRPPPPRPRGRGSGGTRPRVVRILDDPEDGERS